MLSASSVAVTSKHLIFVDHFKNTQALRTVVKSCVCVFSDTLCIVFTGCLLGAGPNM